MGFMVMLLKVNFFSEKNNVKKVVGILVLRGRIKRTYGDVMAAKKEGGTSPPIPGEMAIASSSSSSSSSLTFFSIITVVLFYHHHRHEKSEVGRCRYNRR